MMICGPIEYGTFQCDLCPDPDTAGVDQEYADLFRPGTKAIKPGVLWTDERYREMLKRRNEVISQHMKMCCRITIDCESVAICRECLLGLVERMGSEAQ